MIRVIKLLLLFFAYQLAVTGLFTGLYMLWNRNFEMPSPEQGAYITFLLVVQVAFTVLLSLHLIIGRYVKLDVSQWSFPKRNKTVFFSLLLIIGLGLWNNYLSELVKLPNTMEDFFVEMMSRPLGIFTTVIMAPIMEELLFRGAMEGYLLSRVKNPVLAILLSSFLFGAVHGNPAQIPFAFVIGVGLGWIYYRTKSLLPCVFMHFINNGTAVLTFWIAGKTEASMVTMLGFKGATILALVGVALTIISIVGVLKCTQRGTELKVI